MNNKRMALFSAALLAGLTTASSSSATTLEQAIQQALNTNPDIRIETNELLSRGEDVEQAKAGYLPSIDITAGYGYEKSDNSSTRSAGYDSRSLTRKEAAINLQQMLFDGYATESEVDRHLARQASAGHRVVGVSQNKALETIDAYLNVVQLEELSQLSVENLDAHKRIYDQVALRSEAGIGRSSDLDQVRGRRASADASRLSDLANLKDAESVYLSVVGDLPRDLEQVASIEDALPKSLDEAITIALKEHPTLLSAMADVEATLAQKEAAENTFYPRFDLEVGSTWGDDQNGVVGTDKDLTAMVRMRYNLFSGGKDKARQRQTAHLINEAKEVRNRTYRQVVESLRLSWTAYEATQAQLVSLNQHLISSQNTRDAYTKQFNIGKRTLIDLLNTENEVFEAKRAYIKAKRDSLYAEYRILVGMGRLLNQLNVAVPTGAGPGDEGLSPYKALAPQTVLASEFLADQLSLVESADNASPADSTVADIEAGIERWRKAWEQQNVNDYLAAYSQGFQSHNGLRYNAWAANRKRVISKPDWITLSLENMTVTTDGKNAEVEFLQRYSANNYKDVVKKRLNLRLESKKWLIVGESVR
ncbi:MAG: TolC family outer membrane protein [Sedimenticola sp.]|nr:TolC family outer membrane protein [Sedimenticola sp.]